MSSHLEERVWAFLDGLLDEREREQFERDLLDPALAQAFAEVLMMRELLREVGPAEPPRALLRATERALLRELRQEHPEARRFARARAALDGLSWAARAPQLALSANTESTRSALSEVGHVRYSLGPLGGRGEREREAASEPRARKGKPLWRRLLRRGR